MKLSLIPTFRFQTWANIAEAGDMPKMRECFAAIAHEAFVERRVQSKDAVAAMLATGWARLR